VNISARDLDISSLKLQKNRSYVGLCYFC